MIKDYSYYRGQFEEENNHFQEKFKNGKLPSGFYYIQRPKRFNEILYYNHITGFGLFTRKKDIVVLGSVPTYLTLRDYWICNQISFDEKEAAINLQAKFRELTSEVLELTESLCEVYNIKHYKKWWFPDFFKYIRGVFGLYPPSDTTFNKGEQR